MMFEGKLDMIEKFCIKDDSDSGGVVAPSPTLRDVIRTPSQMSSLT